MNSKLAKMIVKSALGFGMSALIGYAVKIEKKIGDRIDDHYDEKAEQDK